MSNNTVKTLSRSVSLNKFGELSCDLFNPSYLQDWVKFKCFNQYSSRWKLAYFCLLEGDRVLAYWRCKPHYKDQQPHGSIDLESLQKIVLLKGACMLLLQSYTRNNINDIYLQFSTPYIKDLWLQRLIYISTLVTQYEKNRDHGCCNSIYRMLMRKDFLQVLNAEGVFSSLEDTNEKQRFLQALGLYDFLYRAWVKWGASTVVSYPSDFFFHNQAKNDNKAFIHNKTIRSLLLGFRILYYCVCHGGAEWQLFKPQHCYRSKSYPSLKTDFFKNALIKGTFHKNDNITTLKTPIGNMDCSLMGYKLKLRRSASLGSLYSMAMEYALTPITQKTAHQTNVPNKNDDDFIKAPQLSYSFLYFPLISQHQEDCTTYTLECMQERHIIRSLLSLLFYETMYRSAASREYNSIQFSVEMLCDIFDSLKNISLLCPKTMMLRQHRVNLVWDIWLRASKTFQKTVLKAFLKSIQALQFRQEPHVNISGSSISHNQQREEQKTYFLDNVLITQLWIAFGFFSKSHQFVSLLISRTPVTSGKCFSLCRPNFFCDKSVFNFCPGYFIDTLHLLLLKDSEVALMNPSHVYPHHTIHIPDCFQISPIVELNHGFEWSLTEKLPHLLQDGVRNRKCKERLVRLRTQTHREAVILRQAIIATKLAAVDRF